MASKTNEVRKAGWGQIVEGIKCWTKEVGLETILIIDNFLKLSLLIYIFISGFIEL